MYIDCMLFENSKRSISLVPHLDYALVEKRGKLVVVRQPNMTEVDFILGIYDMSHCEAVTHCQVQNLHVTVYNAFL